MGNPLDAEAARKILNKPKKKPGKKRSLDLNDRTLQTWFRLFHVLDQCDYCPRKRMTATLDGIHRICRFCFIDSVDSKREPHD